MNFHFFNVFLLALMLNVNVSLTRNRKLNHGGVPGALNCALHSDLYNSNLNCLVVNIHKDSKVWTTYFFLHNFLGVLVFKIYRVFY